MTIDTSSFECHPVLLTVWQGARLNPLLAKVFDLPECPWQRQLSPNQELCRATGKPSDPSSLKTNSLLGFLSENHKSKAAEMILFYCFCSSSPWIPSFTEKTASKWTNHWVTGLFPNFPGSIFTALSTLKNMVRVKSEFGSRNEVERNAWPLGIFWIQC